MPALPVILVGGGALENGPGAFTTGLGRQALAFAAREQATAVVFSMALPLFARRSFDSPGPLVRIACRDGEAPAGAAGRLREQARGCPVRPLGELALVHRREPAPVDHHPAVHDRVGRAVVVA